MTTKTMNNGTMNLQQIRQNGLEALARELGVVGTVRFLQQFETGQGDYTAERGQWLDQDEIKARMKALVRERETVGEQTDVVTSDA